MKNGKWGQLYFSKIKRS